MTSIPAATRANWGEPPRPRMRLLGFKSMRKNTLRGFASIELPNGLRIDDVPVHLSRGKAWAALPSKPQLDGDGRHRRDPNGKPAYVALLQWRSRDLADRWSAAVVDLVRRSYPNVFEGAP